MKIRDLLADQQFQKKKVLEKILSHHTGLSKEDLVRHYDDEISDDIIEAIKRDYDQYENHDKPLEYIFGYVEFFQRQFNIDGRSLIPRPETEYMIEAVNEHVAAEAAENNSKEKVMLDVGTGTGVLGLSVLMENPIFFDRAYLTEYYEDTLSLAKENYEKHKVSLGDKTHIKLVHSNLIQFMGEQNIVKSGDKPYSIDYTLVANLPYIPDEVFDTQTEDNVRKREPRPAFVWGHDGLDFYREMFAQIFEYQKTSPQSWTMFLEMMTRQVNILRKEFWDKIDFDEIKTFHFNIRIVRGIVK